MFKFTITLTLVCIVAALVLGGTYSVTKPLIAVQQEKEQKQALEKVIESADDYKKKIIDDKPYYEAYKDNKLIGYAIFADGDGYSGKIEMLVGIDTEGVVGGIEILSQSETPGLGARCCEIKRGEKFPWFLKQFKHKKASELSLKNIEALTGATITTEAIIDGVKEEAAEFLKGIKNK